MLLLCSISGIMYVLLKILSYIFCETAKKYKNAYLTYINQ